MTYIVSSGALNSTRTDHVCGCVWQLYIFRVLRGPFAEEFYQCVTYGAYTAEWQEQLYSCLSVLLMYLAPLVTMLTAYMLIFATIASKSRDFQSGKEETPLDRPDQTLSETQVRRVRAGLRQVRGLCLVLAGSTARISDVRGLCPVGSGPCSGIWH